MDDTLPPIPEAQVEAAVKRLQDMFWEALVPLVDVLERGMSHPRTLLAEDVCRPNLAVIWANAAIAERADCDQQHREREQEGVTIERRR